MIKSEDSSTYDINYEMLNFKDRKVSGATIIIFSNYSNPGEIRFLAIIGYRCHGVNNCEFYTKFMSQVISGQRTLFQTSI